MPSSRSLMRTAPIPGAPKASQAPMAAAPLAGVGQGRGSRAPARAAAVMAGLLVTAGCGAGGGPSAGPSWSIPMWPSRSFQAPADTRPPWLPETPPAPVPRLPVPDRAFQAWSAEPGSASPEPARPGGATG